MNINRLQLYHANTMRYDKTAFCLRNRLLTYYITLHFYIERYISITCIPNILRTTVYRKNMNLSNNYVLFNVIKSTLQYLFIYK